MSDEQQKSNCAQLYCVRTHVGQYHIVIVTNVTLPKEGKGLQRAKAPVGGLSGEAPPRGPGAEPLSGVSLPLVAVQ